MKKPIRNIIILGVIAFIGYKLYKKHNSQKEAETEQKKEQSKNPSTSMQTVQMKPKAKLDLTGLEANQSPEQ